VAIGLAVGVQSLALLAPEASRVFRIFLKLPEAAIGYNLSGPGETRGWSEPAQP